MRLLCGCFLLVQVGLLSGCALDHVPRPSIEGLVPERKHPFHAGVYYSPDFVNAVNARRNAPVVGNAGQTFRVQIGASSAVMLDEILPRSFAKTTKLATLSAEEARQKGVDLIIAPSLEYFDFLLGGGAAAWGRAYDWSQYHVAYRITLYDRNAQQHDSWVVKGGEGPPPNVVWVLSAVDHDMEDAAARLLRSLDQRGAVIAAAASADPAFRALTPPPALRISVEPRRAEKAEIVTLRVRVISGDERTLLMRASDMRLRLDDGQIVAPTSVTELLGRIERDRKHPRGTMSSADSVIDVVSVLLFGHPPTREIARDREAMDAWRTSTIARLRAEEFGEKTVKKGQPARGSVFFRLPVGRVVPGGMLSGLVVDPESNASAPIHAVIDPNQDRRASVDGEQDQPAVEPHRLEGAELERYLREVEKYRGEVSDLNL